MSRTARFEPVRENALVARDGDVFIAGQPTLADLDAWAARGVGLVVNLRSRAETAALPFDADAEVAARGMRYEDIPMGHADGVSPAITARLSDALADAAGPVVLHCRTGPRAAHAYAAHLIAKGEDISNLGWPGGLSRETMAALTGS